MRKSIWHNNNIYFFVEYKLTNKKNKISLSNNNSLFSINKYSISSNENNNIYSNLYKKLEFTSLYFLYYVFFCTNMQSQHILNKNIIDFLIYQAYLISFIKFI